MPSILRTNSAHPDFHVLVTALDGELAIRDGAEHAFYHQFNGIDQLKYVLVAYEDGKAVACGAIKEFDTNSVEVKRMYVAPDYRGKGIASEVLATLEFWAQEMGFDRCVLETGKMQPEAIALYQKSGYCTIPNYGQYEGIENSICFEKML